MKKYEKRGISLIVLVITIIVVIIIAGAIILTLTNSGVVDSSKKARFMSDYTNVQDGVNLYSLGKYNAQTSEFELPLKGYLTSSDKSYISESNPTLKTKIEELSGSIDTTNLAWISSEDIGAKLSKEKQDKGYIIDVTNGQIYDYVGDVFEGMRWHTLDGGVLVGDTVTPPTYEELWDGWIKLTLYYPAGSTEKKWRLGTEGELRADPISMWQNYTGPITIPLDRIQDVWIKYKLDNKEVVIPPAGTLLVDIMPDKTGYTKVPGVKVNINFDETATTKEYRVGDSGWITYTGEFNVTENCIIEARAKKTETIYNTDGTVLVTRNIAGRDLVYIGNIGIEETQLPAPTITRLPAVGTEKARVQVTYPAEANKKIYKVNYGIEENYEAEINVENYGTYIVAYYYDASGKRSQAAGIRINDTTTGQPPEGPGPYDPKPPYELGNPPPVKPDNAIIIAPTVVVNPTTIVEEVQVSVNAPAEADKVYIKLGRYGKYELYTSPITVRENMEVYAYYRTYPGERSDTGYGVVSNIKKNNKPYVSISANPYPWTGSYGESEVTVTINYSDTTSIEYSEDGIVYVTYTAPFTVTENKRIYARGTNAYGVTETSLNITNIGKIKPPTPIGNLSVGINVNPEPTVSTARVGKANVTIDYDNKATEKYYSIGKYGELKTYTGSFEVTSNCTIYAYAKGVNAVGQTSKTIDNLITGISQPIISAVPDNGQQASKVSVSIEFDKYSKIKRYSTNGGALRDYSAPFEVTKNGSVIYAYSENELGQKSEATYTIQNIVSQPPVLVLDKGQYYILKLNYPEISKNREYKWKANGEWIGYKEAGILLLKPQYKDQLIQGGTLVKIEDESGNLVTFTGDYYFIDVPISELFENIFMRWDREPLGAPQIVITPTDASISITANIVYNPNLVTKQYKVVNPDGSIKTDWTNYTGAITIDRNNTVIYAKGMDDTEVWTLETMKKVTNIDETEPVIKLTADLDTAQQKVAVKVSVTDDVAVGKVKWAAGVQGESYFTNSGNEIANNSVVNITSNGYYTFYAEDQVGNKQVYTLNVTNVDLTAPVIDIQVSPETTIGLTANVTINYGDSTIKQYKVGTSNATWSTYTNTFAISSYTILAKNWQNADGTVTIYAKGKDTAGNEVTVQKKVVSLDLDMPNKPVINSNAGYPILMAYGIDYDTNTTIIYDTRADIDNYYSLDNAATWQKYTGSFKCSEGTLIAKSVKKDTSLETTITQTILKANDALKSAAYDKNTGTAHTLNSVTPGIIKVDSSLWGGSIRLNRNLWQYGRLDYIEFLSSSNIQLGKGILAPLGDGTYNDSFTIPIGTATIKFFFYDSRSYMNLYELSVNNEAKFSFTNGYMLLHSDPTKAVKVPYQKVTISYSPISLKRLYKIGATGEWKNYLDEEIVMNQNQIIYAKGIDQYGHETNLSSYTVNVVDAIKAEAYDGNDTTSTLASNQYMQVDVSMQGKPIRIKALEATGNGCHIKVRFLDKDKNRIGVLAIANPNGVTLNYDAISKIPLNTVWIKYDVVSDTDGETILAGSSTNLYEIQPSNEPILKATNGYMLLHADPTKITKTIHQKINISYFSTSVQRLYKIGANGEWKNYEDKEIILNQGSTIYAKGMDIYGNTTRIISSCTANVVDALKVLAYDSNNSTAETLNSTTPGIFEIDRSLWGKTIKLNRYLWQYGRQDYIEFLDSNNLQVGKGVLAPSGDGTYNDGFVIPSGTVKAKFFFYDSRNYMLLYEITTQ